MKKAYIYIKYKNIVVLQDYLDVVKKALLKVKFECQYIENLDGISKDSLIVYPMSRDALKYYFQGYRNFAIWQQGATADESYMRNHSVIRRYVLNKIDIFCMKKAKFILYVSDYMKRHYEKMAKRDFSYKAYVMPCFNEEFDINVFREKNYGKKAFTYVGSLDLWQCFEETVDTYIEIEKRISNSQFKVLTFEVEKAKSILKKKGAKNYIVKQVPKEQVKQELTECTYGFIIREDNIVNRVATPTKVSSYLSAGVIPIFSSCLDDLKKISDKYQIGYALENKNDVNGIIDYIKSKKDTNIIGDTIKAIFESYYNKEKHAQNIINMLQKIL